MTSLRPYSCSRTIKPRPCWCTKTNPVGVEAFSYVNAFFMSSMRRSVSSPDETLAEKRVGNTTRSGVFLMNFETFYLVMEH